MVQLNVLLLKEVEILHLQLLERRRIVMATEYLTLVIDVFISLTQDASKKLHNISSSRSRVEQAIITTQPLIQKCYCAVTTPLPMMVLNCRRSMVVVSLVLRGFFAPDYIGVLALPLKHDVI
ncbi:MAG: hypothetical protein ACJ70X_08865 [Nitrososphaera sp.]